MNFDLPNLDVMQAEVVLDQLVRRIPSYTPGWTDYNPSDPGITLLQMLVWLREGTAYTANAIPLETYRNMLRWVVGLSSALTLPLDPARYASVFPYASYAATDSQDPAYELLAQTLTQVELNAPLGYQPMQQAVMAFRRTPFLAITPRDLCALAKELSGFIDAHGDPNSLHVGRLCLQQHRDVTSLLLVSDATYTYSPPQTGKNGTFWISPKPAFDEVASVAQEKTLLDRVWAYLTARMLLGAAMPIDGAHLLDIEVECAISCFARERADEVATAVLSALERALQPVRNDGGRDWEYGATIDASAVLPIIAAVPGVDRIRNLDVRIRRNPIVVLGRPLPLAPIAVGLPRLYSARVTALEADSD